jgi:hypothetical protein
VRDFIQAGIGQYGRIGLIANDDLATAPTGFENCTIFKTGD